MIWLKNSELHKRVSRIAGENRNMERKWAKSEPKVLGQLWLCHLPELHPHEIFVSLPKILTAILVES